MNKQLLKLDSLCITYDGENDVVDNVNLEVEQNQIVCIVGESGSGKTTLIRAIVNLLPLSGKITNGAMIFNGNNIAEFDENQWFNIRGKEIFMIFQNAGEYLSPSKKIQSQFIECIKANMNVDKKQALEIAIEALHKVHLHDHKRVLHSYPFQLSGGMKQRISIAMAIALKSRLILADEPTSALDVITQAQIIEELRRLKKDASVIVVTHDIGCAAYMADKIIVMKNGKVVESGLKEDILHRPKQAYTKQLLDAMPTLKGHAG